MQGMSIAHAKFLTHSVFMVVSVGNLEGQSSLVTRSWLLPLDTNAT